MTRADRVLEAVRDDRAKGTDQTMGDVVTATRYPLTGCCMAIGPSVGSLTAVIALGAHSYMEPAEISRLFGVGSPGLPADLGTAF